MEKNQIRIKSMKKRLLAGGLLIVLIAILSSYSMKSASKKDTENIPVIIVGCYEWRRNRN